MKLQTIIVLFITLTLVSCTEQTLEVKADTTLLAFALSPHGDKLVILDNAGVYIYDLKSKNRLEFIKFDNNKVSNRFGAVAFDPTGERIALFSEFTGKSIDIWEIQSKKHIKAIEPPNGNTVMEIEFSPNGQSLLVHSQGSYSNSPEARCAERGVRTLTLYDVEKETKLFETSLCDFFSFLFSFPNNSSLFFGYQTQMAIQRKFEKSEFVISIVDSNNGQLVSTDKYDSDKYEGQIYDVSPDGKIYLIATTMDEQYNFATLLLDSVSEKEIKVVAGHIEIFNNIDNFLVNDVDNNKVYFLKNNEIKCALEGHYPSYPLKRQNMSTNQEILAVGQWFSDREYPEIQVWDISSCKKIAEFWFDQGSMK